MSNAAASEVEAALIDAYPGLTNKVAGFRFKEPRHTAREGDNAGVWCAGVRELKDKLILISVAQMGEKWGIYEAVRGLWSISIRRVKEEKYNLVLAHIRGLVRGAYRPHEWMDGSPENFRLHDWSTDREKFEKKVCFVGTEAETEVWNRYVLKRVPAKYRPKPGAQTPFRYLDPA